MRGKHSMQAIIMRMTQKLIYVKEPYDTWILNKDDTYRYQIDVLDKVENKKKSFEVQSNLAASFDYFLIMNITVVNNELKILIRHGQHNG